jgi:Putative auto-transporter adhesin, head GIN domain
MKRLLKWALLAMTSFIALLSLSGCEERAQHHPAVEFTKTAEFHTIDFHGVAELKIVVGQAPTVSVTGDEGAVKYVETTVRDGVLSLRTAEGRNWEWFSSSHQIKITITTPSLMVFESSGAGSVDIVGLSGGEQRIQISGAHNIKAAGKLDKLEINLNGAGNINYLDVDAQDVKVRVNGAGNVDVSPLQSLDAEVNGVGAVHYRGNPSKVISAVHGLGSIQPK